MLGSELRHSSGHSRIFEAVLSENQKQARSHKDISEDFQSRSVACELSVRISVVCSAVGADVFLTERGHGHGVRQSVPLWTMLLVKTIIRVAL
jgi:hypothetical protein